MSLSKRKHRTGTVRAISRTGDLIKSLNDIEPVRMYLTRVEAEPRSLKTAIVRESHGAYRQDLAIIKFGKDGEISCKYAEFKPTEEEQATIAKAWARVSFPEPKPLKQLVNLPKELRQVKPEHLFVYKDLAGDIVMVQVRTVKKGERAYIPWSYWSDDVWAIASRMGSYPSTTPTDLRRRPPSSSTRARRPHGIGKGSAMAKPKRIERSWPRTRGA